MIIYETILEQTQERVEPALEHIFCSLGIKKNLVLDHICYRCETEREYDNAMGEMLQHGSIEGGEAKMVSGRPITTFCLHYPIQTKYGYIRYVEIPAPKESSPYKSGVEHIELTVLNSIEHFMEDYAKVEWNTSGLSKIHHPHIELNLIDKFQLMVKFNTRTLKDQIAFEA